MQARNVNGMELREGDGNDGEGGREGDKMNVVWVVDSDKLPFYRAEVSRLRVCNSLMSSCGRQRRHNVVSELTSGVSGRLTISSMTASGSPSLRITRCSSGRLPRVKAALAQPVVRREAASFSDATTHPGPSASAIALTVNLQRCVRRRILWLLRWTRVRVLLIDQSCDCEDIALMGFADLDET